MSKETFIVETLRQAHIDNREGYCELGFLRVEASTMEEAEVKAEAFIKDQEKEFTNPEGLNVIWRFVRIVGVNPIISEGEEVSELQAHVYESIEAFEKSESFKGFKDQ